MIRCLTLLLLVVLLLEVHDIKLQLRATELRATTAGELIKYWLPPISKTRMTCGRCHK